MLAQPIHAEHSDSSHTSRQAPVSIGPPKIHEATRWARHEAETTSSYDVRCLYTPPLQKPLMIHQDIDISPRHLLIVEPTRQLTSQCPPARLGSSSVAVYSQMRRLVDTSGALARGVASFPCLGPSCASIPGVSGPRLDRRMPALASASRQGRRKSSTLGGAASPMPRSAVYACKCLSSRKMHSQALQLPPRLPPSCCPSGA